MKNSMNVVMAALTLISNGGSIKGTVLAEEIQSEIRAFCIAKERKATPEEARAITRETMAYHDRQTAEWSPLQSLRAKQEAEFLASTLPSPDIQFAFDHPAHV